MQEVTELKQYQRAFAYHYVHNGYNATQAYLEVKPNVTQKSANVSAARLLAMDSVQAEVSRIRNQKSKSHGKQWVRDIIVNLAETSKSEKIRLDAANSYAKLEGYIVNQSVNITLNTKNLKRISPDITMDELIEEISNRTRLLSQGIHSSTIETQDTADHTIEQDNATQGKDELNNASVGAGASVERGGGMTETDPSVGV